MIMLDHYSTIMHLSVFLKGVLLLSLTASELVCVSHMLSGGKQSQIDCCWPSGKSPGFVVHTS